MSASMSPLGRAFLVTTIIAAAATLSGCADFDPTSLTDFLDSKKPLPGNRQPVFPSGVPGVPQGVPPDLVKGNTPVDPAAQATAEPAPDPQGKSAPVAAGEAKPKPKPKPKPRKVARPAAPVQPAAASPAQAGGPSAPWPDPPRQAQQPAQQSGAGPNWPAPPAPGTLAR